jgi:uncharacterized LabA/DUF88 family protein
MARNLDSAARVLVFIDGQNAFKACERIYGHGPCHPLMIAERVLEGRRLAGVRYYSGVHDPTRSPQGRSFTDRRHNLMRKTGVTVVERALRYRTEWGFDLESLPDPRTCRGRTETVEVRPYDRAREKGIDLAIGLDVVDLALNGLMDVAVIVSSDTDLCEAARATHAATQTVGNRVSVEAALFTSRPQPTLLQHYDYTHQLRAGDFDHARDSFNYRDALPDLMVDLFVATCTTLRGNLQPDP